MDSVVLLDTHVFLWLSAQAPHLSRPALRAIRSASTKMIADMTLREIALLARDGRIEVEEPLSAFLEDAIDTVGVEVVPISPKIAERSVRIAQNFHGDPADQLIAATAIVLNVPLITADEKLRASPALRTIW